MVIVWIASFPRSGNTFLRIVLKNLYGIRTSVVYDVDGVAERLGTDGRDALVSWARLNTESDPARYDTELETMITRRSRTGTGSWGSNVLSWLQPPAPHRHLLRYEDLVRDPRRTVERAMTLLLPARATTSEASIPSFAELQRTDDRFFRRGRTGTHRDELPEELHRLFWSQPDNRAAMRMLGYRSR